jgi:hypothetical protein
LGHFSPSANDLDTGATPILGGVKSRLGQSLSSKAGIRSKGDGSKCS